MSTAPGSRLPSLFARCLVAMLLVPGATSTADGQTGSGSLQCDVGPTFGCVGMESRDRAGEQEREWARVVVLWRSEEALFGGGLGRTPSDPDALRAQLAAYRAMHNAAQEKEHSFMGGASGARWFGATLSGWSPFGPPRSPRDADTLYVLDRSWRVPMRDTAVIVLVDGVFGGAQTPRVIGALTVPSPSRLKARDKRWTSGDTTFTVRARPEGPTTEEFLRSLPEVRAFLERTP